MSIRTFSSREFNQDAARAKKAAEDGPVIITDRGRPAHVLLTFREYKKLTQSKTRIADLLAMPAELDVEFEPEVSRELPRPADLS